ncbi:unnamed protein product [Ceratitis capitata]|uniref:(Mediterranean fruit fly) hypothetical protein n=1 Tax=Ceratitis capitata TaxID=7213 RepID=A0A811UKD8_CERCA|nr:unnamed protein product [Ceratitis capitata]
MSSWNNICRVCSSPAEYEIFEKIPAYLHASLNEFLHWQKPINVLVEETTGLKYEFKSRIPTTPKKPRAKENVDKDSVLITAQELTFTTEHQIDTNILNTNNTQDQDKDINAGLRDQSQNRRKDDAALDASNAADDQYGKDECGTETSSENNDPAANGKIFFLIQKKVFKKMI